MPLKEDFRLHDIHLKKDGDLLDLHNDYHFTGMAYSVADRRVTLGWRKAAGARIPEGLPVELELLYEDVSRFRCSPGIRRCLSRRTIVWPVRAGGRMRSGATE